MTPDLPSDPLDEARTLARIVAAMLPRETAWRVAGYLAGVGRASWLAGALADAVGPDAPHVDEPAGSRRTMVSGTLTCETPEQVVRASEALQRLVTGFALDGMGAMVSIYRDEEDG